MTQVDDSPSPPPLTRADWRLAGVLAALAIAYFSLSLGHTLDLRDEGYLLNRAAAVAAGAVPHRDFVDIYGPLAFGVTGQVLRLSGGEILGVRVALALVKVGAVVLAFLLARFLLPRYFAVLCAVTAIAFWGRLSPNLNTPYAALYSVVIALLSTFGVLLGLQRRSAAILLAAGVAAGVGILFKQSVGIPNAYGLFLAVWALGMLEADPPRGSRLDARLSVGLWWLAGLLIVLPVAAYLTVGDYLLHFAPFHAGMIVVGGVVLWRGRGGLPYATLRARLLPFSAGVALVLLATAALYAYWGALGSLVWDMFYLPRSYRNYYYATVRPSPAVAIFALGAVLILNGVMLSLHRRSRQTAASGLAGILFMGVAYFLTPNRANGLYSWETLARMPFAFEGLLSPLLATVGVALLLARLVGRPESRTDREGELGPEHFLLPLLFAQCMLSFQVFPRAGSNLWVLHGALTPMLGVALFWWARPWRFEQSARGRRLCSAVLVLVALGWLVNPIVRGVLQPAFSERPREFLDLPHTAGISLTPGQIEAEHLRDLEALIAYLEELEPRSAPLFLLSNLEMIRLFSGRPHLFPQQEFSLFLAGWGILPEGQTGELDGDEMLRRLRDSRDAILIHHRDATSGRLKAALPRIGAYVNQHFAPVAEFGAFRVFRRPDL
jgi:hypothetical protein